MRVASRLADGGGLVAAELKKKDDETDGKEDVEPESGLSGRDTAGLAVDDMKTSNTCTRLVSAHHFIAFLPAAFSHLCNLELQLLLRSHLSAWEFHLIYESSLSSGAFVAALTALISSTRQRSWRPGLLVFSNISPRIRPTESFT